MQKLILAAAVVALATPALAQGVERPGSTGTVAPPPGAAGVGSRQSGATGAEGAANYSPTGRPADTMSNDSGAAGNAGQPSQVAPQGGGGGK